MAKITEDRMNEEIEKVYLKMYAFNATRSLEKWTSIFHNYLTFSLSEVKGIWTNTPVPTDESNRQYISLEQSFLSQIDKHKMIFEGQNTYSLQEKMKISTEVLLSSKPDKMSLQITDEGSIFYSVFKND